MGPASSLVANSTTSPSGFYSTSDKISLGVGIGIGIPAVIVAVWQVMISMWNERFEEDSTHAAPLDGGAGD